MQILTTPKWRDYELIDSGSGRRLERYGKYILSRPDPQAIWKPRKNESEWKTCHAWFKQEGDGKGHWVFNTKIPDRFIVTYKNIKFYAKLTPFKHTGIFPDQAINWDFMQQKIKDAGYSVNILNLFAYTGGATLTCAQAGAKVTHLDASKSAITWARDNQQLSGLDKKPIRWIPDDAIKFTSREIKRNIKYDGIIMDPPVYGHGPSGEKWDFYKDFPRLLNNCYQLLAEKPLFLIINAYALSASALMLKNLLSDLSLKGNIEAGELILQEVSGKRLLSTGIFARWSA